ncbi:transporter substrate-binding domain-containing protein [Endozoicomonas sp. SM1973]|uniref:Transporter substrate-binding domain-containing protein n=1 Tax=Spartinivicinus marinus TaxID=2994442 RepID=A0A853I9W5_9GAMM|nr:transporter substrate-binding domain-containing protein [Spartinivicinus marinus]MCX4028438.1 transporter substrate-binding domain-containing protein [Spartinivicinus marinus]NYZ67448.1 transporter substrate-binding domain-containing protein [Spartinivicinus marinus]
MNIYGIIFGGVIFFLLTTLNKVNARDLTASLAILPIHSEYGPNGQPKGGFVEVVQAIDKVYTEGEISIVLYPFARSLSNVVSGEADFHIPLIRLPHIAEETLPYAYASERITQVAFILYTNAAKPKLNRMNLSMHSIATMMGHTHFFPFKTQALTTIASGVTMLVNDRIEGYIMEQDAVDSYIRKNRIKNVRRELYYQWDSSVVIPKGKKREEIDTIISEALRKLKANGTLQKITQKIHQPYIEWQPD